MQTELKPIFNACDFKYVSWWFLAIAWAIPSKFSMDYDSWVETKTFRGNIYIMAFGNRRSKD